MIMEKDITLIFKIVNTKIKKFSNFFSRPPNRQGAENLKALKERVE